MCLFLSPVSSWSTFYLDRCTLPVLYIYTFGFELEFLPAFPPWVLTKECLAQKNEAKHWRIHVHLAQYNTVSSSPRFFSMCFNIDVKCVIYLFFFFSLCLTFSWPNCYAFGVLSSLFFFQLIQIMRVKCRMYIYMYIYTCAECVTKELMFRAWDGSRRISKEYLVTAHSRNSKPSDVQLRKL